MFTNSFIYLIVWIIFLALVHNSAIPSLLSLHPPHGQLFVKHVYIHLGIVVRVRLFEWWRAEAGRLADQNEMLPSTLLSMNDDPEPAGDDFPRWFLAYLHSCFLFFCLFSIFVFLSDILICISTFPSSGLCLSLFWCLFVGLRWC